MGLLISNFPCELILCIAEKIKATIATIASNIQSQPKYFLIVFILLNYELRIENYECFNPLVSCYLALALLLLKYKIPITIQTLATAIGYHKPLK